MTKWVGIFISGILFSAITTYAFGGGGDDFLKKAAGHYEGSLTTHLGDAFSKILIKSDLSSDKNTMKTINVTDESDNSIFVLQFNKIGNSDLVISGSFIESQARLKRNKGDDCFVAQESQPITLCFSRELITLDISDKNKTPQVSLALNSFAVEKPTVQEMPKVYDLKTAIDTALKFNFDNQFEYQNVLQARFKKKIATGNLAPHAGFGTIVNNVKPTILSIIGAAGDLLPFLFPTRWLAVKQAGQLSEAEQETMTIVRLNTASQVEALFYTYDNDRTIQSFYGDILERAKPIRKEVDMRENTLGALPQGSTADVDSLLKPIEQTKKDMDALLLEDKAAIAQALGSFNPQAVLDIKMDPEPITIAKAQPLDSDAITKLVIERSIELRQNKFLLDAAQANQKSVTWNWLDPQGDPTMEFGAGWKPNIEFAKSQIVQLQVLRNQIKQQINQKVFAAVTAYNQALSSYVTAEEDQELQNGRLEAIERLLLVTGKIDNLGLIPIGKYQDYLEAQVSVQRYVYAYRVARAQIDRLLLQGYYVDETKPPEIKH